VEGEINMVQIFVLLVGAAIFLFFTGNAMGEISELTNLKSGLMVLGGTLMCAFLAYPFKTFKNLVASLVELFRNEEEKGQEVISEIETLAHVRWLYGVREMEEEAKKTDHAFIRKGISLVADDYDRFEIYDILEKDVELFHSKRTSQINILETLGKLAPAFGFVGTIIGLISVLSNMENPSEIGKGMSIALLTTLYGSLISNFIFLPLGRKLSEYTKTQAMELNLIMEGIMDICDKKNPKAIAHRLRSYSGAYPSKPLKKISRPSPVRRHASNPS
jgi:chemotaxis protein MotA